MTVVVLGAAYSQARTAVVVSVHHEDSYCHLGGWLTAVVAACRDFSRPSGPTGGNAEGGSNADSPGTIETGATGGASTGATEGQVKAAAGATAGGASGMSGPATG
jgi:hypothetical protein